MKSKPLDYGVSQSMEDYMAEKTKENWGSGGPYEQYVGRWSRKIAINFLHGLTSRQDKLGLMSVAGPALSSMLSSLTSTRTPSSQSIGRMGLSPRHGIESMIRECASRSAMPQPSLGRAVHSM